MSDEWTAPEKVLVSEIQKAWDEVERQKKIAVQHRERANRKAARAMEAEAAVARVRAVCDRAWEGLVSARTILDALASEATTE